MAPTKATLASCLLLDSSFPYRNRSYQISTPDFWLILSAKGILTGESISPITGQANQTFLWTKYMKIRTGIDWKAIPFANPTLRQIALAFSGLAIR